MIHFGWSKNMKIIGKNVLFLETDLHFLLTNDNSSFTPCNTEVVNSIDHGVYHMRSMGRETAQKGF